VRVGVSGAVKGESELMEKDHTAGDLGAIEATLRVEEGITVPLRSARRSTACGRAKLAHLLSPDHAMTA
jgi:hypothetical protein